jgi:hypothetical protein
VRGALRAGIRSLVKPDSYLTTEEQWRLDAALQGAEDHPGAPERFAQLAPDATAPSALLGGVHVAASFPGRDQVGAALRFAAGAPDGDSVSCTTGALLGAAHGFEALPVDLVSRHELAWVLDSPATWSSHTDVARRRRDSRVLTFATMPLTRRSRARRRLISSAPGASLLSVHPCADCREPRPAPEAPEQGRQVVGFDDAADGGLGGFPALRLVRAASRRRSRATACS